MSEGDVEAPGWRAIDQLLVARYPNQVPHQFTSQSAYDPHSPSPLPAVTAFETAVPSAWHVVSYGLSELFEKVSPNPTISGFGFEVTLLVPRASTDERPPAWAIRLLQAVGRQQLDTQGALDTGHCINFGAGLEGSAIEGLACVPDPWLGKIDTVHGTVLFLRLVGLTRDELDVFSGFDREATVLALGELDPYGVTDLQRTCWLADEEKSKVVRRHQVGLRL